jgi:peptidoglycan/xylan/chitin deacetylase (PgdA/CDA1 family)
MNTSNKIRIVTTSWDDGHPCDRRLADMLAKYSLPGTFYVPLANQEGRPVVGTTVLRDLVGSGFEIGAHTVSHRALPGLSNQDLLSEVNGSKQMLEEQLGKEVCMFCYPLGRYDSRVTRCVEQAGFTGARTIRMLAQSLTFNRYEMPTTLQAFAHPPLNYIKNLGKRRDVGGMGRYFKDYLRCGSWVELGKKLFREVDERGGIWHLYGHSWEVDEFGLWEQLDDLLNYVSNKPGIIYATNSGVIDLLGNPTSALAGAA